MSGTPPPETSYGTVVAFDEHKGYGTVRTDDGRELFFHCTAIADGSRTIALGADVTFSIVPGHLGRWEATDVRGARETPPSAPQ